MAVLSVGLTKPREIIKLKLNFILTISAGLAMKTVSMLDFRLHAEKIIGQLKKGQRIILTRRGKPVARLEPIVNKTVNADDPFFSLDELADVAGETLSNAQIDDIVYGS